MAAHVFGERIHHQVAAVFERFLEHRTEERVVHRDRRAYPTLLAGDPLRRFAPEFEVHEAVGGIGGRLGD